MSVTIYDIARRAGVGIGTVSRCLNNHPHVAPETRARVMAVVRRLNYQPHAQAQRLASRRTNTVSLIIPSFTNYFFIQVLQGVQDRAVEAGIDVILYTVNFPAQVEHSLRRSLHRGHVDGVLFFSMRLPAASERHAHRLNIPMVLVDAFHPDFDSIVVQNVEGAKLATRHLLSLGHRSIAMLDASLESQPAQDRMTGYRLALEEAGIPFDMNKVFISNAGKQDGFSRESGRDAMRRLILSLRGTAQPTAVFISSDVQAIGALETARGLSVRVPGDLAVVSFDDIELAQFAELTTMRQPMYEMGRLAMDHLMARMRDPDAPASLTSFLPELVIRSSCGAHLLTRRSGDALGATVPANHPFPMPTTQGVHTV
jgi:LacI family transcriptional regulator